MKFISKLVLLVLLSGMYGFESKAGYISSTTDVLVLNSELEDNTESQVLILSISAICISVLFVLMLLQFIRLRRVEKEHKVKADRLKEELTQKKVDLQTQAMHLIRTNNYVGEIEEKLRQLKPMMINGHGLEVQRIINDIRNYNRQERDWKTFNYYFNELQAGFIDKLKAAYPDLTLSELRLCALIKMNLTNMQIANMLNVATRSCAMAKYRLKKKLNLGEDMELGTFLINLDFSEEMQSA